VLIDLPGLPREMTLERFLDRLELSSLPDLRVHLVLSPLFAQAQMAAFERQYYAPQVSSLVWTKLDEAYTFGAMVNTAVDTGLPVSALSFGSGLKDTLVPAKRLALWRALFKHQLPARAERTHA
jgi:flagellar biosynthesis protein FlhF